MKTLKSFLSVVFISLLAISCGGGGGGDDNGGGGSQVTQESVNEFISSLIDNSDCTSPTVSASVKRINISSVIVAGINSYSRYQSIPRPIKSVMQALGPLNFSDEICTSGGSFTFTPTDDTDTMIGGVINANQCVSGTGDSATSINGSLTFSLQGMNFNELVISEDSIEIPDLETTDIEITGLTLSSSGLTIQSGGEDVTLAINASALFTTSSGGDLTGVNGTLTNLSVTDNVASQTFSLTANNTITGLDTNVVQFDSSGTYTDSELGTFTFSTPTGLTFDSSVTDEETATGTIQVDGADGSDFLVTINDDDSIIIDADVDGDGSTDFSGTVNCSGQSLNLDDILS